MGLRSVRSSRKAPPPSELPPHPSPRRPRRWAVRIAREADLTTLVCHRRQMWGDLGGRSKAELDRADPVYRSWVRRLSRAHKFVGFLVEAPDGTIAGSGAIWLQPSQPRPGRLARQEMPYILSMYTEPAFRGQGIASSLVQAMVRWASTRGYRRIFLHASRMGRSVYSKLGFLDGNEMRLELPVRRARRPQLPLGARRAILPRRARPGARSGPRRARH